VAPTREPQAAAQARGGGQQGPRCMLGWVAAGDVRTRGGGGEGKTRGYWRTSLGRAAKTQQRWRVVSGARLEERDRAEKKRKRVEGGREPFQNFKTTQTN
jgi:hypothetical protein